MGTKIGNKNHNLRTIIANAVEYDFYQAVRLIKRLDNINNIYFKVFQALVFPRSSIDNIICSNDVITIYQSLFGLTGQNAVLPDHFTELLLEQIGEKDTSLVDFLDIFNSRILTLFYQSWEKSNFYIGYESTKDSDQTLTFILSLIGVAPNTDLKMPYISHDLPLYYSGLFSQKTKTLEGLKQILQDHFTLPITINQFCGEWVKLDCDQWSMITSNASHNNQLSVDTILGKSIWDLQHRFEVKIGPLTYQQYLNLLPNTEKTKAIKTIISFYVGSEFTFIIRLVLKPSERVRTQLKNCNANRLGWDSWLLTGDVFQAIMAQHI